MQGIDGVNERSQKATFEILGMNGESEKKKVRNYRLFSFVIKSG
jgi:hypothetical protein